MQRLEELAHEEGVAAGLLQDELGKRLDAGRVAGDGLGGDLGDVLEPEPTHLEVLDGHALAAQILEGHRERVLELDLVVAVRADEEEARGLGVGEDGLEHLDRGGVDPLEIVEEDHERARRPAERAEEAAEHQGEAVLRLDGTELEDGRLLAQDHRHVRDDVDDDLPARPERVEEAPAPRLEILLALAEDLLDEPAERRGDGAPRDVALELIVLARDEVPERRRDGLVQLVDQRRLADARVPRDHEARPLAAAHAIEGPGHPRDLGVAAMEPLRHLKAVRHVVAPESEEFGGRAPIVGLLAGRVEAGQDLGEVGVEAPGRAVPLLRGLGEQLHHHAGERLGERRIDVARRRRVRGDVRVDQRHRIRRREGEPPGEELVQRAPQRIEIGPVVDRPVHSPRLLRGHVGERPLQHRGVGGEVPLLGEGRSDAEIDDLELARRGIAHDVRRVDVLVDHAAGVDLGERAGHRDGDLQRLAQPEPAAAKEPIERLGAEVLQADDPRAPQRILGERAYDAGHVQGARDLVLLPVALQLRGRRVLALEHLEDDALAAGDPTRPGRPGTCCSRGSSP